HPGTLMSLEIALHKKFSSVTSGSARQLRKRDLLFTRTAQRIGYDSDGTVPALKIFRGFFEQKVTQTCRCFLSRQTRKVGHATRRNGDIRREIIRCSHHDFDARGLDA